MFKFARMRYGTCFITAVFSSTQKCRLFPQLPRICFSRHISHICPSSRSALCNNYSINSWVVLAIEKDHTVHFLTTSRRRSCHDNNGDVIGLHEQIPLLLPGSNHDSSELRSRQLSDAVTSIPAADCYLLLDRDAAELSATTLDQPSSAAGGAKSTRHPYTVLRMARRAGVESAFIAQMLTSIDAPVAMCLSTRLSSWYVHSGSSLSTVGVSAISSSTPHVQHIGSHLRAMTLCFAALLRAENGSEREISRIAADSSGDTAVDTRHFDADTADMKTAASVLKTNNNMQ